MIASVLARHGALRGYRELIVALATDLASNALGSEAIGREIDSLLDLAADRDSHRPIVEDLTIEYEAVLPRGLAPAGHASHHPQPSSHGAELLEPGVGSEREGVAQDQDRVGPCRETLERVETVVRLVDSHWLQLGLRELDRPGTQSDDPEGAE